MRRFFIGWLCFLLPLIFLSSNGCSTEQAGSASKKDLEKYRKVYLVRSKSDPHNLTVGVLSRLKAAGFDATEIDEEGLKKIASAKDVTEPTMACQFNYVTTWDYERTWYSFVSVDIRFSDIEKGQKVFEVSHMNYNFQGLRMPENTELNRLFIRIRDSFFPGQPNPFRDNPKGPYGPAYQKFQTDI